YLMFLEHNKRINSVKIIQNGREINSKLAAKIYKLRKVVIKYIHVIMFTGWAEMNSDFIWSLFSNWTNSIRDWIFLGYIPVYFYYAANGKFGVIQTCSFC